MIHEVTVSGKAQFQSTSKPMADAVAEDLRTIGRKNVTVEPSTDNEEAL